MAEYLVVEKIPFDIHTGMSGLTCVATSSITGFAQRLLEAVQLLLHKGAEAASGFTVVASDLEICEGYTSVSC